MAVDPVPYFIAKEGVKHSGEIVRQALYDSTSGAEGVSGRQDLKVVASAQPDKFVQVLRGGGLMVNRYPTAGPGQSYSGRNNSQTAVEIAPTGSGGGRTDLVVMRVLDPQYEGQPPADPNNFQYTRLAVVQGVPPDTFDAASLNLGYPAIALARVTMPQNTIAVQPGYITDLRRIARPKREMGQRLIFPTNNKVMSKTAYESWPFSGVMSNIEVPYWANSLDIVAVINGIEFLGTGTSAGGVRTMFDPNGVKNAAQNVIIKGSAGQRQSLTIMGTHPVALNQRGKVLAMSLQGFQTLNTAAGSIEADYQSGIAVSWVFTEVPD